MELVNKNYSLPAGLGSARLTVDESLSNRIDAINIARQGISSGQPTGILSAALSFSSLVPGLGILATVGGLVNSLIGGSSGPSIEEETLNAVNAVGQEVINQSQIIQSVIMEVGDKIINLVTAYATAGEKLQPLIVARASEFEKQYQESLSAEYNDYTNKIQDLKSQQDTLYSQIDYQNSIVRQIYQESIDSSIKLISDKLDSEQQKIFDSVNSDLAKIDEIARLETEITQIDLFNASLYAENLLVRLRPLLENRGFKFKIIEPAVVYE